MALGISQKIATCIQSGFYLERERGYVCKFEEYQQSIPSPWNVSWFEPSLP